MSIAALYDIHGNVPALDAVIKEFRRLGVNQVVIGGDVMPGPMAREALTRLLDLDIPVQFIRGNGELAVLEQIAGKDPSYVPEQYRPAIRWTAQQLDFKQQQVIAGWPRTTRLEVPGLGTVLFCHATPRSETEVFTRLTPERALLPLFEGLDVQLAVCGHTHMQFDRMVGKIRVVNAGSVGMPFGAPGADWLLLGPDVQLQHCDYDLERAAQRIRESGYPQAHDFAANNVLKPPSETKMLELFTASGLK
jgi:predicted phosphodiesterase